MKIAAILTGAISALAVAMNPIAASAATLGNTWVDGTLTATTVSAGSLQGGSLWVGGPIGTSGDFNSSGVINGQTLQTSGLWAGTGISTGGYVAAAGNISAVGTITATSGFVGALTGNVTGNTSGSSGSTTGNAATATALAADPANCGTATEFAVGVTAAGVATCEAIADADVPNALTIDTATGAAMNINNDAGANTTTIGGGSTNGTVFIGTGATAKTVTIGTTAGAGTVNLLSGSSGGVNVTGNATVSGTLGVTGTPVGNTGLVNSTAALTGAGSIFQAAVKGRADVAAGFGSTDFVNPAVAWGVRGEVDGTNLAGTYNYVAGVAGKYNIAGTNASTFPKVGVLGLIDGGTSADAAVMAELDGDTGVVNARAGYGIMTINSTSASGFSYGMDLQLQTIPGHTDFSQAFKVADIRLSSGTTISSGATNPATCVKGSIYLNTTSGLLNVCQTADTWTAK